MAFTLVIGLFLLLFFIWCCKKMYDEHNYLFLIPIIIVGVILVYSFGTTNGSLRLAVLWTGHPVEAFQTDFKEVERDNDDSNKEYYVTTMDIKGDAGTLGLFEVNYYWIFKIAKYYGY